MEEDVLQLVRLRLSGWLRPVHVLRLAGNPQESGRYPGAEPLCVEDGRVLAAHSYRLLLQVNEERQILSAPRWPITRVLDAKGCRRALARPHHRWHGWMRGAMAEIDDVLHDAAASLDDSAAAERIRDSAGFHGLYDYVWGHAEQPPPMHRRLAWWDEQMRWLRRSLHVMDAHQRLPAHHR
ncbi:hypothetical protein GTR02_03925 [Kineococcus sp. R8]|uniref:hypothetical protein n=1 Tax=Kineococcus siccus TaxID=2696567 RepID=UPI001412A23B|nr:hypothetical protein [Kineococcus siccus]NAZ80962.1 hypothetical protein [Kineococcus siccus]